MLPKDDPSASDYADSDMRDRFAISPLLDIEIDVAAQGSVGLTADADHDLRTEITAAVIARTIGITVATARKYVRDMPVHVPRDGMVRTLCRTHLAGYDAFYRNIPVRSNSPLGVFAFDLAVIRSRTSLELMFTTARQGYLIEPCLMARSVMEQFAYASHVWMSDEDSKIFSSRPQALISTLSQVNPFSGRAYGMLSSLAHYDPKMHYSFIGELESNAAGEESSTVIQRSWKFKVVSLAWFLFILDLKFKLFRKHYGDHPNFHQLMPLVGTPLRVFDDFFAGVELPAIQKVRGLFGD